MLPSTFKKKKKKPKYINEKFEITQRQLFNIILLLKVRKNGLFKMQALECTNNPFGWGRCSEGKGERNKGWLKYTKN